jgi:hypothetical protein
VCVLEKVGRIREKERKRERIKKSKKKNLILGDDIYKITLIF